MSFDNITRFVIAGDWHGDNIYAGKALYWAHKQKAQALLSLGDTLGTNARIAQNLAKSWGENAKRLGISLAMIDGNHDPFDLFKELPFEEDGTKLLAPNFSYLPRGYRFTIGDLSFLAMGGATSVDREMRTPGHDWFLEEALTNADLEQSMAGGEVDIMLTHDAPDKFTIPVTQKHRGAFPLDALFIAEQHRKLVGMVVDEVKPKVLFHGHFHDRYGAWRDLPDGGQTLIQGMDMNGRPFTDNMILIDLETGEGLPESLTK